MDGADFLFVRLLDDLEDRLATVMRNFGQALYIGPFGARVADMLKRTGKAEHIECVGEDGTDDAALLELGLAPDNPRFDLIVSLGALHETNDTPGILAQLRRALKPDGLLIVAMPGGDTLGELRDSLLRAELELGDGASPRVLPFMDVRAAGSLLQRAGFALPVTDLDEVMVRYDTIIDLMMDLRAMGATNTLVERAKQTPPRQLFAAAHTHYASRHADADERLRATFCFIWMSGWAPDASQPKPLKPGSATVSLADALKAKK
ncbi:MAG: methyltransferase domain-containing protein [Ahrensia sp.]